jgi:hypothetical protein
VLLVSQAEPQAHRLATTSWGTHTGCTTPHLEKISLPSTSLAEAVFLYMHLGGRSPEQTIWGHSTGLRITVTEDVALKPDLTQVSSVRLSAEVLGDPCSAGDPSTWTNASSEPPGPAPPERALHISIL